MSAVPLRRFKVEQGSALNLSDMYGGGASARPTGKIIGQGACHFSTKRRSRCLAVGEGRSNASPYCYCSSISLILYYKYIEFAFVQVSNPPIDILSFLDMTLHLEIH